MPFEPFAALIAGLIAGVVMELPAMSMKMMRVDMQMDINRTWGSMFGVHGGAGRGLGFLVHLALSALVGLIYAWGFPAMFNASDNLWLWGLLGGLIHWFIAGLFMGMLPAMHPEIPERQPAPGLFVKNFGMPDMPGFLMGHLLYGLTFGIAYAYLHSQGGGHIAF